MKEVGAPPRSGYSVQAMQPQVRTMTPFSPDDLLNHLIALPTQTLSSERLSQVVASLLDHHNQPWQLKLGHQRHLGDTPHYWVEWQHLVVDFRYPGLSQPEQGIRPIAEVESDYRPLHTESFTPVPLVLLASFCRNDHAHFDHLAAKPQP
ncbi:hypothetical protein [Ferrimonas sp. SCSIO 43195]|uniref:hypothetical protein n=1 Tax=Ferrimonas sp. SCSIO 43195 TaxID=2822844 RepID=UPI0020753286|nr:hypothetical protein [Ferrimonas sp. SCSIO 43195]USD36642.1 hypothetical protein J8Z22_16730 [Ferrimonas sp. SCSIO 43195]